MKLSTALKFLLSLSLAGIIFYFVFKNVKWAEFVEQLEHVNYWWVLLSIIIATLSHILRAFRWRLMLKPLGHNVSLRRLFYALMSGYLANLVFPRLGEVTRCGVLKKTNNVPISMSFGTVVIERLLDLVILLSMVILDLILEFDKVFEFFKEAVRWEQRGFDIIHVFIVVAAVISLGILSVYSIRRLLKREFSNALMIKISLKVKDLMNGLLSIRTVQNPGLFILTSLGIWVCYFLMSYVIFFSVKETSGLSIGAGLSILAAAGIAMATPVQGGIGAYHFLVSQVLILYGIGVEVSKFFAFLLHTSQVVFILSVGGVCMIIASFISKKRPIQ
ncbi:lysylphosphatidylglycerol synthase transmembrane domain-containing protein [Reichenbachiella versicolor]|uniref:lysylphosphatidylglycerol synthase transmembrane domain-containing protein n=1 Tax=Reichenbachiella versicolor TaxID=1821036 RepID=UPI000D6DCB33|nr:lysylphosphatidylglycerol synthase transmembrane domain-containing protein [Reichenbachiella versicolor]